MNTIDGTDLGRLSAMVERARTNAARVAPSDAAPLLLDVVALAHDVATDGAGVAAIAAATHRSDADDVHWPSVTHPGSIIWPASIATLKTVVGADALRASAIGYEVTVELADLLATAGITRWHRTSVAGQGGAAAAAAVLTNAPLAESIALALTTASGIGQTVAERASAGAFHRACAARNGVDAAAMALGGLSAPSRVLTGDAGLLAACGAIDPVDALGRWSGDELRLTAIGETCLRVYPTNGFAQAAVAGAAELFRSHDRPARRITVTAHPAVVQQFSGEIASRHWDLLAAVASTVETGDPSAGEAVSNIPASLVAADPANPDSLRPGDATVEVDFDGELVAVTTRREFAHPSATALAAQKWHRYGVEDPDRALSTVAEWLDSPRRLDWQQLVDLCGPMSRP